MSDPTMLDFAPAFMSWPIPGYDEVKPVPHYDIEPEVWQAGRCGICGLHQEHASKRHSLDHDHHTGLIRGVLCTGCNLREGRYEDRASQLWREGVNPCNLFGWHYVWRGSRYAPEKVSAYDARRYADAAAVRRELAHAGKRVLTEFTPGMTLPETGRAA